MKPSPDPHEPLRDGSRSAGTGSDEFHGYTGSDAEIERGEDALLDALGPTPGPTPGLTLGLTLGLGPAERASREPGAERSERAGEDFQSRLRAQFLGAAAEAKLGAWAPDPPREEFTARLRRSFLVKQSFLDVELPRTVTRRPPRASAPAPARTTRFRWAAAAGILAAAAAVLLFFLRDSGGVPVGDGPGGNAGKEPDGQVAALEPSGWSLDTSLGEESALLGSLRLDGVAVASAADFSARMATARRIETLDQSVRIRHRDEFVMELAADSAVLLDDWHDSVDGREPGQRQVLRLDLGGIRVATGPGFSPASPLVVETLHVRTEVVGTIFGLDLESDYTCVCCLEGSVRTTALHGERPCIPIGPERTRVVLEEEGALPMEGPLVEGHRDPLERLVGYWA